MPPTRLTLNKIAEVTIWFWLIKIVATTLGETFGDYIAQTLDLGYVVGLAVTGGLLAVILAAQIRARDSHRGPGRRPSRRHGCPRVSTTGGLRPQMIPPGRAQRADVPFSAQARFLPPFGAGKAGPRPRDRPLNRKADPSRPAFQQPGTPAACRPGKPPWPVGHRTGLTL